MVLRRSDEMLISRQKMDIMDLRATSSTVPTKYTTVQVDKYVDIYSSYVADV